MIKKLSVPFGPRDAEEAYTFAVEELRADVQYALLGAMKDEGISQARLADRLGMSPAAVSQFLGDDANLTIESMAKLFLVLGRQCSVQAVPLAEHYECLDELRTSDVPRRWLQEAFDEDARPKSVFGKRGLLTSLKIAAGRPIEVEWANDNDTYFRAEQLG